MRIPIEQIAEASKHRPKGYFEDVVGSGSIVEGHLEISEKKWIELRGKYSGSNLFLKFLRSVFVWIKAGAPVPSILLYRFRRPICGRCTFWNNKAMMGLGRCGKCGCTRAKLWLKTETCPIGNW